jgi:hypothetical protein
VLELTSITSAPAHSHRVHPRPHTQGQVDSRAHKRGVGVVYDKGSGGAHRTRPAPRIVAQQPSHASAWPTVQRSNEELTSIQIQSRSMLHSNTSPAHAYGGTWGGWCVWSWGHQRCLCTCCEHTHRCTRWSRAPTPYRPRPHTHHAHRSLQHHHPLTLKDRAGNDSDKCRPLHRRKRAVGAESAAHHRRRRCVGSGRARAESAVASARRG